jgi:DNA polymerase III alpha subunit
MGVVRGIKRGKGWSRVEVLDSTGSIGIFDDEETKIEAGRTYIILVGSNRIMEAIPVEEIQDNKSALVRFLNYKQLPYGENEYYVLSFKPRITKTGKRMATMVVADNSRGLSSVVVFPTAFAMAYTRVEEGKAFPMEFSKTKDGDITLKEVSNVS